MVSTLIDYFAKRRRKIISTSLKDRF